MDAFQGSSDHSLQVTVDRGKNECTIRHCGTSAAAPNAVGVFALAWIRTKTIQINSGVFRDLGRKKYNYEGGVLIGAKDAEAKMKITKDMMIKNNFEVWISHTRRGM